MIVNPGDVYTLRIKRMYYDKIQTGEKTREYRDYKPFYAGLEAPGLRYIRFHYQGPCSMLVEIKGIAVVNTPDRLKQSSIPFGPKVYEIRLGRIVG